MKIGRKRAGGHLKLPAELITETVAILGRRGSGKTNTATVMVEELLEAGGQVVILDPVGVWWGLKSSADGKRQGFPVVVLGGAHGDLPISEDDGKAIADWVVDSGASAVIGLDGLDSRLAERRFITAFANQLYQRKRRVDRRTPLHVVLEEASLVVPQRIAGGDQAMVGAIQRLVRQGRVMGLGVTLIDQRPASINKDVLTQLELLIAHQITSPQDRKALEAWIEAHDTADRRKDFLGSLAALDRGEAWIWSPAWLDLFERVQIRPRRTYDSSATPKPGEVQVAPQASAEIDLDALQAQLADTIERAREDDPRALKKRIAELEKQLAEGGGISDAELLEHRAQANIEGKIHAFEVMRNQIAGVLAELDRMLEIARHAAGDPAARASSSSHKQSAPHTAPESSTHKRPSSPHKRPQKAPDCGADELTGYQLDLLKVLIDRSPVPTPRSQLGALAGKSIKSSAFGPNLRRLIAAGLAEKKGRGYVATRGGMQALPGYEPAPLGGAAALQYWVGRLPRYESTILSALDQVSPTSVDRDEIAELTRYSPRSSAFGPALRNLLDLEFIEKDGQGYRLGTIFTS